MVIEYDEEEVEEEEAVDTRDQLFRRRESATFKWRGLDCFDSLGGRSPRPNLKWDNRSRPVCLLA